MRFYIVSLPLICLVQITMAQYQGHSKNSKTSGNTNTEGLKAIEGKIDNVIISQSITNFNNNTKKQPLSLKLIQTDLTVRQLQDVEAVIDPQETFKESLSDDIDDLLDQITKLTSQKKKFRAFAIYYVSNFLGPLSQDQMTKVLELVRTYINETSILTDIEYLFQTINKIAQDSSELSSNDIITRQLDIFNLIEQIAFRAFSINESLDNYQYIDKHFNLMLTPWKFNLSNIETQISDVLYNSDEQDFDFDNSVYYSENQFPTCDFTQKSVLIKYQLVLVMNNVMFSSFNTSATTFGTYCQYFDKKGRIVERPSSQQSYISTHLIRNKTHEKYSNQTFYCYYPSKQDGKEITDECILVENTDEDDFITSFTCKCNQAGLHYVNVVEIETSRGIILYLALIYLLIALL